MDRLEVVSSLSNPVWTGGASAPAATPGTTTAASTTTTPAMTADVPEGVPKAFAAEFVKAQQTLEKGERLRAVEGHAFARIKGGERHDMCVNVSGNERSGDAFDRIFRDGRVFHVYGEGRDRVVVEVKRKAADDDAPTAPKPAPASGTTGATAAPKQA